MIIKAKIHAASIQAIGSYGQTIYSASDTAFPFSLEMGDPHIISEVIGFDTGLGNTLVDLWIKQHRNLHYENRAHEPKQARLIPL